MPISKDKTRMIITIDIEDKKKLEEIAKEDGRSLNNLIVMIFRDFLDKR